MPPICSVERFEPLLVCAQGGVAGRSMKTQRRTHIHLDAFYLCSSVVMRMAYIACSYH